MNAQQRSQLELLQLDDVKETGIELGRGAYGVVTELIISGTVCAAKKLHDAILQDYTMRRFSDEVVLHSQQRHPNIVQLMGVYYPPRSRLPMLIMEYLPFSLTQCLEKEELPLQMKYSILLDIAKGVCYLHGKRPPIVHRDLTANNVLLTSSYTAKISDLGVSRLADTFKKQHLTTAPGNAMVMPPEALQDNPEYDHKLDVFSYGCLILHVLTGQFPEPTNQFIPGKGESYRKVPEWNRRLKHIQQIPKENELLPLAQRCLNDVSSGRPEMIDCHQFVERILLKYPKTQSALELIREKEEGKKKIEAEKLEKERLKSENERLTTELNNMSSQVIGLQNLLTESISRNEQLAKIQQDNMNTLKKRENELREEHSEAFSKMKKEYEAKFTKTKDEYEQKFSKMKGEYESKHSTMEDKYETKLSTATTKKFEQQIHKDSDSSEACENAVKSKNPSPFSSSFFSKGKRLGKLPSFGGNSKKKRDLFEVLESVPMTPTGTTGFRQLDEPPDLNGGAAGVEKTNVDDPDEDNHLDEEMILERMKPIAVASFHGHVQQMHVDSDKGFEMEYKSVPMQTGSNFDIGRKEGNKTKNRFANIFPYDFSRVKLTELPDSPDSDYINACYIDGYSRKDCYIAAQGPLPSTITDFCRMIWEYRINHIVMLTGVIEGGRKKCEQYWPEKIGESLELQNGMVITMTSSVQFADYVIRDFKASKADSDEKDLVISHYHFTSWPDHGVPQFATSLIRFIKRVQKDHNKEKNIPLLVHCSAGVGRTGTFVMLDIMMDRLKAEESINVYEVLRQLRSKRMYMVQTQAQYVFLHDALDELTTCGDTAIIGSNLRARVNKMHKLIPGKNITEFHEQFELLEQVGYKPSEMTYSDGTSAINVPKNRYPSIVPLNNHRPRLRPDGSAGSDYINASFVDGYKQRNAYLVTQGPLKSTVDDFWRMMMEFKSRTIVQLCNTVEEGQENCQMYWPTKEGEPVEYGRIKVTLQSETTSGGYVIRKLHICNERGGKSERDGQVVTQFHYISWPEHGHPASTGSIIELIDLLTRAQMNTGNRAITVVCNDGVGRTGAFLCIHSQLERLKTEGEVDVFKYLKTARTRRIGLLSELDHYVFCHEVLADFVESFDPYANFKTDM